MATITEKRGLFGVLKFGRRSASLAASGFRPPAARRSKPFIRRLKKSFAKWPRAIRKTSTRPSDAAREAFDNGAVVEDGCSRSRAADEQVGRPD